MKWIELHLKCKKTSDDSPDWESMGVDESNIPIETEFRTIYIREEIIDLFYPNTYGGSYILVAGMELTVQEDYDTIKDFIHASQL